MFEHPSLTECETLIEDVHTQHFGVNYGLLITGESGVGKTFLGINYTNKHPVKQTPEKAIHPVLFVKLTETKTANDLLLQIMKSLSRVTNKPNTKSHLIQDRLHFLFIEHGVQLVIIDEVQECLTDIDGITSQRMAKQFCALIDNNPAVSFVLIGTPVASRLLKLKYGKAECRLKNEEQLSRRFLAEKTLHSIPSRCKCWLDCCNYFSYQHGISLFTLCDKAILNRLHVATLGKIGLLNKLFAITQKNAGEKLLSRFELAYLTGLNSSAYNPFDERAYSDRDIINILDSREFD